MVDVATGFWYNSSMTAFYGQVLVEVGGELLAITLPVVLYRVYLGLICDLESGTSDTHAVELCRRDAHCRLRNWFMESYPHVSGFDEALGRRVGHDIVHFR